MRVSVVIPTQRRPEGLTRACRSVFAQQRVDHAAMELLVVDNDAAPSAAETVRRLAAEAPFPVRYVHEPRAGVANARNAAMAATDGELVAFLDDDEEASPGWLAALLDAQTRFGCDAVFGPVRARADWDRIPHAAYLERFFSRLGPAETGRIDGYYGCGDSLVRRAALPHPTRPFNAIRNLIGGEDDLLFGEMHERGASFAWSAEAWVWEHPAPERLRLGYAIRRAFAFGQGPTAHSAACGDRLGVARWMLIGVAQALLCGAEAAAKGLVGAPGFPDALDRAARGVGKVLWWRIFKIRFYGLPAAKAAAAGKPSHNGAASFETPAGAGSSR
ncbi:MAG TPA: glycosyltransferase family 2 protein [Caulobacteraceae bacterium]|jgi:glycosyltransferase involved in cell wall biosynthesis